MTPMFVTLCQFWSVDHAQAQHLWQALQRTRWSEPRAWLHAVLLFDRDRATLQKLDAVVPWLRDISPPRRVVGVLENLVQERQLRRKAATQIEDGLFAKVTAAGQWVTV